MNNCPAPASGVSNQGGGELTCLQRLWLKERGQALCAKRPETGYYLAFTLLRRTR